MPLGLNLNNLLGTVTDTVDDLLGSGVGDIVDNLAPGDLIDDLGGTLNNLIGTGTPTGLLQDLLDNGLVDLGLLQDVLGNVTGDGLNLDDLGDLLDGANLGALTDTLDDVFDSPLLGLLPTVVDSSEVAKLTGDQLEQVIRYVTGLVGSITEGAGGTSEVEALVNNLLLGDNTINGDAKDNDLQGGDGNDTINGDAGQDLLLGDNGDDSIHGGLDNDTIDGGDGNDMVYGDEGRDSLYGGEGEDSLFGGTGNDRLDGGAGADRMAGGADDDLYIVNNKDDVVVEAADGGHDTVKTTRNYTMTDNVEDLKMGAHSDLRATGNVLDNRMDGNDGNNQIDGAGGDDFLFGGLGADTLTGGSGDDIFRYLDASESGLNSGHDVITDFGAGDHISVRAFDGNANMDGNQAFKFVGEDGAFLGHGRSSISFEVGSGSTLVSFDSNGDGAADFRIELTGEHHLTAADFLL